MGEARNRSIKTVPPAESDIAPANAVRTAITQHEGTVLVQVLARIESAGREDRKAKRELIAGLKLDAAQDRIEDPLERSVKSDAVLATFDQALASLPLDDGDRRMKAMNAAIQKVLTVVDAFVGLHGMTQVKVEVPKDSLTWLVEKLAKTPTKGAEDSIIDALETRFRTALVPA